MDGAASAPYGFGRLKRHGFRAGLMWAAAPGLRAASGLRLALDDQVADIDMLSDDREAPGGQVNLGPAQPHGFPAAQSCVGDEPVEHREGVICGAGQERPQLLPASHPHLPAGL